MYIGNGAVVESTLFTALANRSNQLDRSTLDVELVELVEALNQVPGITTGWSCAGHTQNPHGYIMWVGDNEQLDLVNKFIEYVIDHDNGMGQYIELGRMCDPPVAGFGKNQWYPSFCIRWVIHNAYIREMIIGDIVADVNRYLYQIGLA